MIKLILKRILTLPTGSVLRSFSSFDDFGKGSKGKSKFFGKKDKPKEVVESVKEQSQKVKQTHHKTVKFMKKHEMKNKQPDQPQKKELRFRKKDGYDLAESEKPSPFVRTLSDENEDDQIKKSIFFSRTTPSQTANLQLSSSKPFSLPQLNEMLASSSPQNKFYEKLSEDLDGILLLFENRQWKELSQVVQKYYTSTPAIEIEKELHSLLIAHNAASYSEWIRSVGRTYKDLSEATLRKLYNQLLRQQKWEELTRLLEFFGAKGFNIEYQSVETVMADLTRDASYHGLEAKLSQKIDLVISLFKVQKSYFDQGGEPYEDEVYILGEWFNTLAHLALDRKIATRKFLALFDEIFTSHWKYMDNDRVYGSGLFMRVISEHYFGTHVTREKLYQLFTGLFVFKNYFAQLVSLRNLMVDYRARTGKAPFPNVKDILPEFNKVFELQQEQYCYFYLNLLNHSDQPFDIHPLLEKREILLRIHEDFNCREILNDLFFKLAPSDLASRPVVLGEEDAKEQKYLEKWLQQREQYRQKWDRLITKEMTEASEALENEQEVKPIEDTDISAIDEMIDQYKPKWILQDPFQDNDVEMYGPMDAESMGWKGPKQEIYNYLAEEEKAEGNPYRKELLKNVLRAKLNGDLIKNLRVDVGPQGLINLDDPLARDEDEDEDEEEEEEEEEEENEEEYNSDNEQAQEFQYPKGLEKMTMEELKAFQFDPEKEDDYDENKEFDPDDEDAIYDHNEMNRPTVDYNNVLAIQSAIKLGKLQLAYALCEKIIMEPLITQRAHKNIVYAIKAYLTEENEKLAIPDFANILECVQGTVDTFSREYLRSVYQRCDSFDELIWSYCPPKKYKFDFWRATLALDRGHELIKMDISNKLRNMKHQPEYDTLPYREKDDYITKRPDSWRQHLMKQLGIVKPAPPMEPPNKVVKIKDDSEFFNMFLYEKMFGDIDVDETLAEEGLLNEEQEGQAVEEAAQEEIGEGAEGEEALEALEEVEEVEEVVEEVEEAEALEAEQALQGEQAQAVQGEEAEAVQVANQQPSPVAQDNLQMQAQFDNLMEQEVNDEQKKLDPMYGIYSNFDRSATSRLRGYDFANFLNLAKTRFRPEAEKEYQQQKELKKFLINIQSLCEESFVQDVHYLQKKLHYYQRSIKSLHNVKLLLDYGLWNYEFVENSMELGMARTAARNFRDLFYRFKTYMGEKGKEEDDEFNNERFINITFRNELMYKREFTKELVEDLLLRRFRLFKDAEATAKLAPVRQAEQLVAWGVRNDEPMAIYLGEKIAMLTNQLIPHKLALQVSNYLSHRREVPAERVERCKECLKVVGRVNREHIYDFNKEYGHITSRNHFQGYLAKRSEQLNSTSLDFLSRVDPTHSHHPDALKQKRINLVL